ncbi:hypothetical protein [Aquamicrobium sp.]|uniref:hypothetical protein n=1 Tax=Aquamicrobium sp. TaxID=1872579 RepID=UPI0025907C8D|nr:hypothetical protein [Aquamicrobium sp.]MCK9550531.1 beta/gamma crystallin family protein [Aquamicrobium sp.]
MRNFLLTLFCLIVSIVPATAQVGVGTGPLKKIPLLDDRKMQNIPDMLRERMRNSLDGQPRPAFRQRGCTFYEHANYQGKSKKFTVRTIINVGQTENVTAYREVINYIGNDLNDRVSSIRCDDKCGGWAAIHANMGGQMVPFVDPLPNLSTVGDGRFNDSLSSLELLCW